MVGDPPSSDEAHGEARAGGARASRYLWKHHDRSRHTVEQACLEIDEATGAFVFTERSSYADWGDKVEHTQVRRGFLVQRGDGFEGEARESIKTEQYSDHEMGTADRSQSASEGVVPMSFTRAADGGLACPPALSILQGAGEQTMSPSEEPLFTLFLPG